MVAASAVPRALLGETVASTNDESGAILNGNAIAIILTVTRSAGRLSISDAGRGAPSLARRARLRARGDGQFRLGGFVQETLGLAAACTPFVTAHHYRREAPCPGGVAQPRRRS